MSTAGNDGDESVALFSFEPRSCGAADAGQRYVMRALQANDFQNGLCALLGQLTQCGEVTEEMFARHFAEMKRAGNYHTVVIEDTQRHALVGTATLLTELKFTHACGKVGHIEDVVADDSCRGQGFGKQLVLALVEVARREHCYKVILDASEKNTGFYEKCGFQRRELQMRLDLDH